MSNYDDGLGISIGSKIRNTSNSYPIIELETNAASGIGWFAGPGTTSENDVNNGYDDADKFLKNLPIKKRTANYVAIFEKIDTDEVEDYPVFAVSANPVIYVYKGPITNATTGDISDSDWMGAGNWHKVTSTTTGGSVELQIDGAQQEAELTVLDIHPTANEISVSYGSSNLSIGIVDNLAKVSGNIYLGEVATDYIEETATATSGLEILNTGYIKVRKDNANTVIDGKDITTGTVTTSGNASVGGTLSVGESSLTTSALNTATVSATSLRATNLQLSDSNVLRVTSAADGNHLNFGFGVANTNGIPTNGGDQAMTTINSNLTLANLTSQASGAVEYVITQDASDKIVRTPKSQFLSEANTFTQGSGISISAQNAISVNSSVVRTTGPQQINARKGIGSLAVTGNIDGETIDNHLGLKINSAAITDYVSHSISTANRKILYIVEDGSSTRDRYVHTGVSGYEFINDHVIAGAGLSKTTLDTSDAVRIDVDDIYVKTDADDLSLYKFKARRLGVNLFTPGEIDHEMHLIDSEVADSVVDNVQQRIEDGATIFEWVREGGTYVNSGETDTQDRRDAGVIMKAGFTHFADPYTTNGINKTEFRFSAKGAGVDELTSGSEELAGTFSTSISAATTTYSSSVNDFAIQIGTAGGGGVGHRLNEVVIPNLFVKNLTTDGGNYLSGGGTLEGDWTVTGNLSVSGIFSATQEQDGTAITLTGSLLQLGGPTADSNDDTVDDRDFGIAGIFNYTADSDSTLENDEAHVAAFFRDASATAITTIAGRGDGGANYHKPWKLLTSSEVVNAPGATSISDAGSYHYAPLEVGSISLKGYGSTAASHYQTDHVNRIITNLTSAKAAESGASDVWETYGHNSLITAKGVEDYVTIQIGLSTLGSVETDFDYGLGLSEEHVTSDNEGDYDESNAYYISVADGNTAHRVTPQTIGLALDFDSDNTAARGTIGYMPHTAEFKQGSSLRSVIKAMLTEYLQPTITIDANTISLLLGGNDPNERYQGIAEHGSSYGTDADMTATFNTLYLYAPSVTINNWTSVSTGNWRFETDLTNLSITKSGGGQVSEKTTGVGNFASAALSLTNLPTMQGFTTAGNSISVNNNTFQTTINLQRDDSDNLDYDGIAADDGQVLVDSGLAEGTIKYTAHITELSNDQFTPSGGIKDAVTQSVRRRSFYFVSNWNISSWYSQMADAGTPKNLNSPVGVSGGNHSVNMSGEFSSSATGAFSNKLMHYMLCAADAGGSGNLGADDIIDDADGNNISFSANLLLLTVNENLETTNSSTSVKLRHATNATGGGDSAMEDGANTKFVPHMSAASDIRRFKGFLAAKEVILGTAQEWAATAVTASPDGFVYRAVPIEFAGSVSTADLTAWKDGIDHKFGTYNPFNPAVPLKTLVLDEDGDPAHFEMTNQYGETQDYVLFQEPQAAAGANQTTLQDIVAF